MKNVLLGIFGTVIGVGLLTFGIVALAGSDEVRCGSSVVTEADRCTTLHKRHSKTRTVDEQRSQNRRQGWICAGIGGLMTVGSPFLVRDGLAERSRRRTRTDS